MKTIHLRKLILIIFSVVFISACSLRQAPKANLQNEAREQTNDPFEVVNRAIFKFNDKADKYLIKPLAKTYQKTLPKPIRQSVYNFFDNLNEPRNIVNNLLQGKFNHAGTSSGRLVINSSLGLLGLFDVASKLNIPKHNEDFGQTLALWNVPKGPYLVLPLFGPRNLRHAGGMIPDWFIDPANHIDNSGSRLKLTTLNVLNARSRYLSADQVLKLQLDPYVFLRETYLQKRQSEIYGHVATKPTDEFDEFDEDE